MEILQIENLSFSYPQTEKKAVDNVDLTLNAGDFALLCGESGCGKSTLLKLIKRQLAPFGEKSGRIMLSGVPQEELDEREEVRRIGFVMQDPESQIVTDTVWHELAFGLENLGEPTQVIRRRVAEMASYFGIEAWFYKKTTELSGGQKQLLNLASVMAMQPEILILDEPTAQLDPIAAADFIGTVKKLNRELGLTVLMVEHRLEEVFPLADRVLIMQNGKLCFDAPPQNAGEFFVLYPSHPMRASLPCAMRIFSALGEKGESPLTVRQGRRFISENYKNDINTLEITRQEQNNETLLELKELWFRYKKELPDVLKGVSLKIKKAEHFCILGGNGAGKSTMLSVAAGLLKPFRGKVILNGKAIERLSKSDLYRKNIALLPQDPKSVFTENSLIEDMRAFGKTMEIFENELNGRISEITEMLGLGQLLDSHPLDMSGGEQQKAALAKLLLSEPKVLLLDEPTKGIDAFSKQTLIDIIIGLNKKGVTVVTVTHDVEFAAAAADRCGMFFSGELMSVDAPESFFAENSFYTTAANRIARGYFNNAVLCEHIVELCRINGKKEKP